MATHYSINKSSSVNMYTSSAQSLDHHGLHTLFTHLLHTSWLSAKSICKPKKN